MKEIGERISKCFKASNQGFVLNCHIVLSLFHIILFRFVSRKHVSRYFAFTCSWFFQDFPFFYISLIVSCLISVSHGAANRPTNQSGFPSNYLESNLIFLPPRNYHTLWMCLLALCVWRTSCCLPLLLFSISYLFSVLFDESQIRERWFDHRSN